MNQAEHDAIQDAAREGTPTEEESAEEHFLRTLDAEIPISDDLADQTNTDVALDFYLERLAEREAEMTRNAQVATRRMDMIQSWLREANAQQEREARWLRQMIERYAHGYDFGKKKSRSLPHGVIGFRSRPGTLEITDPAAALAFAVANGLETKLSVNKTPLLNHFKATGEIPDGAEYVEGGESFYIRTGSQ